MNLNDHDEQLVQRCLDDELSPAETRQLLTRLESLSDGWRALACGFIEERNLRKAVRSERGLAESTSAFIHRPQVVQPMPPTGSIRRTMGWWGHPVTSLSLCAAIAFATGLLIPDLPERSATSRVADAGPGQSRDTIAASQSLSKPKPAGITSGSDLRDMYGQSYQVEFQPDGPGSAQSVQIPVTRDPAAWSQGFAQSNEMADRIIHTHPELREQSGDGQLRAFRVRANETEDLIFFVNERNFGLPAQ